jgi:hypothetical protein
MNKPNFERLSELRAKLNHQAMSRPIGEDDARAMRKWEMPYPQDIQILINCDLTNKYQYPNKRSLRHHWLDDPVICLLNEIVQQTHDLVWKDNLEKLGKTADDIDSIDECIVGEWVEYMTQYTKKLIAIIQHRATLGFDDEQFNIKQLYQYLDHVSRWSEDEVAAFILNEIPQASWDWEIDVPRNL